MKGKEVLSPLNEGRKQEYPSQFGLIERYSLGRLHFTLTKLRIPSFCRGIAFNNCGVLKFYGSTENFASDVCLAIDGQKEDALEWLIRRIGNPEDHVGIVINFEEDLFKALEAIENARININNPRLYPAYEDPLAVIIDDGRIFVQSGLEETSYITRTESLELVKRILKDVNLRVQYEIAKSLRDRQTPAHDDQSSSLASRTSW